MLKKLRIPGLIALLMAIVLGVSAAGTGAAAAQTGGTTSVEETAGNPAGIASDFANYPSKEIDLPEGCSIDDVTPEFTYAGVTTNDLRQIQHLSTGQTLTAKFTYTNPACATAIVSLAVHDNVGDWNPGVDQDLVKSAGVPISVGVIVIGDVCGQLDAILGRPLLVAGPSGSNYNEFSRPAINGVVNPGNLLISAANFSTGCAPQDVVLTKVCQAQADGTYKDNVEVTKAAPGDLPAGDLKCQPPVLVCQAQPDGKSFIDNVSVPADMATAPGNFPVGDPKCQPRPMCRVVDGNWKVIEDTVSQQGDKDPGDPACNPVQAWHVCRVNTTDWTYQELDVTSGAPDGFIDVTPEDELCGHPPVAQLVASCSADTTYGANGAVVGMTVSGENVDVYRLVNANGIVLGTYPVGEYRDLTGVTKGTFQTRSLLDGTWVDGASCSFTKTLPVTGTAWLPYEVMLLVGCLIVGFIVVMSTRRQANLG